MDSTIVGFRYAQSTTVYACAKQISSPKPGELDLGRIQIVIYQLMQVIFANSIIAIGTIDVKLL